MVLRLIVSFLVSISPALAQSQPFSQLPPGDYSLLNHSTGYMTGFHVCTDGTIVDIIPLGNVKDLPQQKSTALPSNLAPPSQQPGLRGWLLRSSGVNSTQAAQMNAQQDAMWYNTQVLKYNAQNGFPAQPIQVPNVQPGGVLMNRY
jgi:hypothetical protein